MNIPDISGIFKSLTPKYNKDEGEVSPMISFDPLWATMRAKGITTYRLIEEYKFSRGTLDSLKHNRNVTTATLNDLCRMLDCRLDEIAEYVPDEEDQ